MAKKKTAKSAPTKRTAAKATGGASAGKSAAPRKTARKKAARKKAAGKQAAPKSASVSVTTPVAKRGFPIVAIGASAGGLEAMQQLLEGMPANTGMGFVVVTHQHPGHVSLLPELLNKITDLPVFEATDGKRVRPNQVYVAPPGSNLTIHNGTLHHLADVNSAAAHLPIDSFFRSLAEDQNERGICIVLSGTGTDGTLGLRAIKAAAGMAMVEQPQSAKYAGMPASAISTGLVDYVLAPSEMAEQLVAYVSGPYLTGQKAKADVLVVTPAPMQKIILEIRSRTGHDFSAYKSNTLRRRIERRMNVHQIDDPDHYVRYLQATPHEIDILFKELLISVTNFFRDPEAWQSLEGQPLQGLLSMLPDDGTFRAWIPGCATGEEVFSLIIMLREAMDKAGRRFDAQVFGTDLDAAAIETARAGRYPDGIASDVSPERLEKYFTREDDSFRVRKEIREMAVFAPQNVIKDPPFTRLNMISCRNLLIYLEPVLQKKLLPIFHYALKPGGLMVLGPSETVGPYNDLFETVDKRWKIYRRVESASAIRALPEIPAHPIVVDPDARRSKRTGVMTPHVRTETLIERVLLDKFAPASIVTNDRGDIVYIYGRTGVFLEPTSGKPRNNIIEMAREGLQIELASAIRHCTSENTEVVREDVRVRTNGDYSHVRLNVSRLLEPESLRGLLLITIREMPPIPDESATSTKKKRGSSNVDRIGRLEHELQYMKETHQTTQEELETSNEELKSTNEELQSTNEELQSTNEELETSKEEMQSLNEELTTVNAELQSKVDDLSQANDDMQNLLNSTDIATVFLDCELAIKRFTEQARELIMVRPTDVGRPLVELATNLRYTDLVQDCHEVLRTLVFREQEVQTKSGDWFLTRIMPYRTSENVIDGLVITFVSIGRLKAAENALDVATTKTKSSSKRVAKK